VTAMDEPMTVVGDTTAMAQAHEVEYQLTFDSSSIVAGAPAKAEEPAGSASSASSNSSASAAASSTASATDAPKAAGFDFVPVIAVIAIAVVAGIAFGIVRGRKSREM
ncbi:MAG: hypothetical protein IJH04_07805, partial [Eggerthellaceae bacterium]|nr:hypothetical protein [Eggerthellaceae bacterium]